MRAYDLAEDAGEVETRVVEVGGADVRRLCGDASKVEGGESGGWRRVRVSFGRWYTDYGGTAHVDFRLRRCGGRTFVLVFMHRDYEGQDDDIAAVLASFRANSG